MTKLEEIKLISKIAKRAVKLDNNLDHLTIVMDLTACMENGNELRLEALLNADDFNFSHDIYGIYHNLNRETLQLENCFLPRYTGTGNKESIKATINFLNRTVTVNNETIGFTEAGIWDSIKTSEDFLLEDFDSELFADYDCEYIQ
jgi:hypothetical protein